MIKDPSTIKDGQALDTTLAITVENMYKEIKDRGTVCQNDIISIESLLGEKIVTEAHNINKFCSIRDTFNTNIVLESLDDYMRRSFNVHYRISLSRKLESIAETIKSMLNSYTTYSILRDYTRGKAYNTSGILVNVNELTINELLNSIRSVSLTIGGVDSSVSLVQLNNDENNKRSLDVPYSTLLTIFDSIIPDKIGNTGLYDYDSKNIRINRYTLESAMVTIICSILDSSELMDGLLNINNLTDQYSNGVGSDEDVAVFNKIKSYDYVQNFLLSNRERIFFLLERLDSLSKELSSGTMGNFRGFGFKSYNVVDDVVKTLSNGDDSEYFHINTGHIKGSLLPSSVYYTLSRIFTVIGRSTSCEYPNIRNEIFKFNNIVVKEEKGDDND